jgi:DNA helicase-2/ATP-dependent DNA helicase PcrA
VFANGRGKKLYQAFQERLKILNAADFGDLLLENIRLFRENPDVLRQYQQRFKYVLVDEYQDTNVAQYLWLRLLGQRPTTSTAVIPGRREAANPESSAAATELEALDSGLAPSGAPRNDRAPQASSPPKNICCVGDDDQSIYGWRGAEVDNILRFEHDFPGAKIIRLERNYRSTGHILAAAAHLIAHNEGRLGKTLRTEDEPGEKVTVTGAWDSEEEARSIGEEIEQLQRAGHKLDEIAILVRASFQMREFEDRFVTLGLPYRVIGGPRFYERQEVRDALAYLRVVHSAADDLAFERIVNVPRRGLGDATIQFLHEHARRRRVPLFEAARAIAATDDLKPRPRTSLRGLIESFERWRTQNEALPHTELAEIVLDESGYTDMWQKDKSADAAGRLENLKELVRSMEEFENLAGFLEHISLVMDVDRSEGNDAVNVMTLHSAKGLEFDTVFLPGWEEGLFPHQRALDEQGRAGLEEERRLAHVGLTRARRRAKIYFATNRRTHGLWQTNIPSRFVDELPEANVEVTESKGGYGAGSYGSSRFDDMTAFGSNYGTPGWQRAQANRGRGGFDETGQARYGRDQDDDELGDVGDADPDHLSPVGRGRAEGAGEGDRTHHHRAADSPSPLRAERIPRPQRRRAPLTIEGELVAKSTGTASDFSVGDRVFHLKFGNGNVVTVDGNKLTIAFDKAGEKRVVDSFVERV